MSGPLSSASVKRYTCPVCGARVGEPCREPERRTGRRPAVSPHLERVRRAGAAQGRDGIVAVWSSAYEQGKRR